jgi:hypothetical protein
MRGQGEIQKGRRTSSAIQTQRPSLPIISSLAALFARWLFHPRTPIRSFVSLLGACLRGIQPPSCWQGSILAPPAASAAHNSGSTLMLPDMSVRLR